MSRSRRVSIQDYFSDVTDPRRRKVTYPLVNIISIAICAVLCGADDFVAIAAFARKKSDWRAARDIPPRFRAVGKHGSIAVVGRFHRER